MDEHQQNYNQDVGSVGSGLSAVMDSTQQTHGLPSSSSCGSGVSGAVANDARLEFISSYTLTTLKLKQDKWQKMLATPEYQMILIDWLNNTQRRVLVMLHNPAGILIPKNAISDLYQPQSAQSTRTATTTATSTMTRIATAIGDDIRGSIAQQGEASMSTLSTTTTTAAAVTVAASVAMTPLAAPAMMAPLPPPSSSFSTLDGVPRGKCAFFLRRELNVPLTTESFHTQIICGDFPIHSKIDTLLILFDEILQPMLENPLNRCRWPDVVAKDVNGRLKDVRNIVSEIKGQTNNRTILSLLVSPQVLEEVASHIREQQQGVTQIDPATLDDEKLCNQLEEMVINWTTQVHDIITERSVCTSNTQKTRSSSASRLVNVSLPVQEIHFWINRQCNLENMYNQLRAKSHKNIGLILEGIDSPYRQAFANLLKNVVCAWHEAQDVSLWLQPLLRHTVAFNAVTFANAKELIVPLVHVIHLIWSNSRHYRSTIRMTVLLRCICNLMIRRANEDLEMTTLFQSDADEGLSKITKTLEVLEMFKATLLHYKGKYSSNQTILPAITPAAPAALSGGIEDRPMPSPATMEGHQMWRFSNEDVFGYTLDDFIAQLHEVQAIFEAAVVFQSLDKLEIGGCMGKILTEKIRLIHTEFTMLFESWNKLEIDVTQTHSSAMSSPCHDTHWQTFKQEQVRFFEHMNVIEKKLATILVQAYGDCHNWEQLTKLTMMFANIVQRQTIQFELRVILAHILSVYEHELLLIERIVSEVLLAFEFQGIKVIPVDRTHFPDMAGAMVWLEQHMKRCDVLTAPELNALLNALIADNPLSPQFEKLTVRRNILTTKLSNLQLKIWHNWQQTIEKRIVQGLDSKVMMMMMLHSSSAAKANVACANTNGKTTLGCHIGASLSPAADDTKILEINFAVELFTLLRETKYLLALQQLNSPSRSSPDGLTHDSGQQKQQQRQHLPQALLDLYAQRDIFWQRKIKLMQLAEYYNGIRQGLSTSIEMQLIHPSVSAIDEHLASAVDGLTWRHYDDNIVDFLHDKAESLYRQLEEARTNISTLLESIRQWSHEPLHQRSIYGKNLLEMRHQQQRLRTRLLQCTETKSLLNRFLAMNFCLFFNYDKEQIETVDFNNDTIHEFLCKYPEEQREQFNKYLEFVDQLIYDVIRQAMKIRLRKSFKR